MRLKRAEEIAKRKGNTGDGNGKISENVQRELALMTSAWYGMYQYKILFTINHLSILTHHKDLTGRLQSDAVIVQRRAEGMPRSFLGRQRRRVLG